MNSLAFVFPGQGSQQKGMLADSAARFPVIGETFTEASAALGLDLWTLCQQDEEALNRTENTQPALLTAGVALWRAWQSAGGSRPAYLAGHSFGSTGLTISSITASMKLSFILVCVSLWSGLCWVDSTTVSMLCGLPST